MTEKEINQMSKDELEILCRKKGVELDRRLKKSKLVATAISLFVTAKSVVTKTINKPKASKRRLTFRERYGLSSKK